MVFTRAKKMIRPIRIANGGFSRVRKMIPPIRSHRGVLVSRQNSRLLQALDLTAPSFCECFAVIQLENFFSKSSSRKKVKSISEIGVE